MFTIKKRGAGKFKTNNTIKEFYKEYEKQALSNKRKPVEYSLYNDVIKSFNYTVLNKLIAEARTFKLPYNLGYLGIIKYQVDFDPNKINKWKVNYAESKKLGYIVYHDEPFRYRWYWDKNSVSLKGKRFYKFIPSRMAHRTIKANKVLNPGMDYYTRLSITDDGK